MYVRPRVAALTYQEVGVELVCLKAGRARLGEADRGAQRQDFVGAAVEGLGRRDARQSLGRRHDEVPSRPFPVVVVPMNAP